MVRRIGTTVLVMLGAASIAACGKASEAAAATPSPEAVAFAERSARGKYLVSVLGCNDCHTPLKMTPKGPERDWDRLLSGHPEDFKLGPSPKLEGGWMAVMSATTTAYRGPWGTTYAMNLTPDVNTGIGLWTEEMFMKAIRLGKHWGTSRPIMPPMPWDVYRNLTDEDLKSVYAFLRTIKPITNHVPDYEPPPESED